MTLQFVIGKASVNHENSLLSELAKAQQEHPDDQFYYLVPNHIKFESEVQVLTRLAKLFEMTMVPMPSQGFRCCR